MSPDFCVFVVDDEPMQRELLTEILTATCTVETFPDAESCLDRLKTRKPDMFLLDVGLPRMNGYDLCRQLKDDFETSDIPVTFISGMDSLDARVSGYECGAEDFIVKPFDPDDVLHKVEVASRILHDKKQLSERAGYAQNAAMLAMTSMSELGVVLEFLRRSFALTTQEAMAQSVLDYVAQYGLEGAVQVRIWDTPYCLGQSGADLPLECSILSHVRSMGRIFEFRNRGVYNYDRITLMVNNMPLDDPDRCGRLRDNLAILVEGADARLQAIRTEASNENRGEGILQVMEGVRTTLNVVRKNHKENYVQSTTLMYALLDDLERSFVSLGLTDAQEYALFELVSRYTTRLIAINEEDSVAEARLEAIEGTLAKLTEETAGPQG